VKLWVDDVLERLENLFLCGHGPKRRNVSGGRRRNGCEVS
jgi:hypothetical protein